jgi:hypothetical protein
VINRFITVQAEFAAQPVRLSKIPHEERKRPFERVVSDPTLCCRATMLLPIFAKQPSHQLSGSGIREWSYIDFRHLNKGDGLRR